MERNSWSPVKFWKFEMVPPRGFFLYNGSFCTSLIVWRKGSHSSLDGKKKANKPQDIWQKHHKYKRIQGHFKTLWSYNLMHHSFGANQHWWRSCIIRCFYPREMNLTHFITCVLVNPTGTLTGRIALPLAHLSLFVGSASQKSGKRSCVAHVQSGKRSTCCQILGRFQVEAPTSFSCRQNTSSPSFKMALSISE